MTQLTRKALHSLPKRIDSLKTSRPNPGLLLRRGLADYTDSQGQRAGETKADMLKAICSIPAQPEYRLAFNRWKAATSDADRFAQFTLELQSRLYIGVTRDNPLETGVMVSHTYGMPYIAGSSLKGVARGAAKTWMPSNASAITELFGAEDAEQDEAESGVVVFHDAWWSPTGGNPFVPEIVTPHHTGYYMEGGKHATDFDDPVPAPQIAVQGSFLFVIEGPAGWRGLAEQLLSLTLSSRGVGGRTTSGYGVFKSA